MTTLSEVIRELATKAGMTVIDVGNVIEFYPTDVHGIPTPRSWDRAGNMMIDAVLMDGTKIKN